MCLALLEGEPQPVSGVIRFEINLSTGEWTVWHGSSSLGTFEGTCTSVEYSHSEDGVSTNWSINISGGECIPLPPGKTSHCDEDAGGDDCEESGNVGSGNQSDASVAYLTGHKIERGTDLTVSLPGRDFSLVREYSSDADLFGPGPYYWNGYERDVIPGHVGVNWSMKIFPTLFGDHELGSGPLYLGGLPLRTSRAFELVTTGSVRFAPRASTNEYIFPTMVNHPVFGSGVSVYRVREPGGIERDFARMPTSTSSDLGMEDVVGLPLFERDAHGNVWYYEWVRLVDRPGSDRDPVVLKSLHLNWDSTTGDSAARVDFWWNGQDDPEWDGVADPDYAKAVQFVDTDTDGLWDAGEVSADHHYGRLAKVRVVRFDDEEEITTDRVRYLYFEDIQGIEVIGTSTCTLGDWYDGSPGDLCEVTVSTMADDDEADDDGFHDRVWQYRYYSENNDFGDDISNLTDFDFVGDAHQLLAVIYPEQMEFFADHYAREAVAQSTWAGGFTGFNSVSESAPYLRWAGFATNTCLDDEEDFLLPNPEWQGLTDVVSKLVTYTDLGGRVASQIVNAGDGSGSACGCGSVGGYRLGKRFDYLYRRFEWDTVPDGVPATDPKVAESRANGYSCQVVESMASLQTVGEVTTVVYTPVRVYCHDYYWLAYWPYPDGPGTVDHESLLVGIPWKVASVIAEADPAWDYDHAENPLPVANSMTNAGRRWVTMYEYTEDAAEPGSGETFTAYHEIARTISPAANNWHEYEAAVDWFSAVLPSRRSTGLVSENTFTDGWRSATAYRDGTSMTVVTPAQRTYAGDRVDLVTQMVREPGTGPTGDTPVETTQIVYGYHNPGVLGSDPNGLVIAWEEISVTAETMAQNGPDSATVYRTYRMYDTQGHLRWDQHPDRSLTYYEYDPATGALVKVVRDAAPTGAYVPTELRLPSAIWDLDETDWELTTATVFAELTDTYTVDLLGRVISHTSPGGVTSYMRYEVNATDLVESDGGLNARGVPFFTRISLPHKLTGGSFDGPITVSWMDAASRSIRTSRYEADGGETYTPLEGVFSYGPEVARSDTERMISGLPMRTREWHVIGDDDPASGYKPYANEGSYVTFYEYDTLGRVLRVIDPENGISAHGGYDVLDRATTMSAGVRAWGEFAITDSTLQVSTTYYDSPQSETQGVGNGNVTLERVQVSASSGEDRVTEHWYDFRDRRIGSVNLLAPHFVTKYDDLNRVVSSAAFTSDVGFSGSSVPDADEPDATRSTYSQTLYNNRGLVYRTRTAVDPTDDSDPELRVYLESNRWYNSERLAIASWDPNGAGVKTVYDVLHRPVVVYQTDRYDDALPGDSGSFTDAMSVTDDHVIEQTEYVYVGDGDDGAGSVELVTTRMRFHDLPETTDGDGPLDESSSISTYTLYGFDDASRVVKTYAYGTNSTDGFVADSDPPTLLSSGMGPDSGALVSEVGFDAWGRTVLSVSPSGKETLTVLDPLSRQIAVVEGVDILDAEDITWNATDGYWDVAFPSSNGPTATDRATTFTYDGLSNVVRRVAHFGQTEVQETRYTYGVTAGSPSTPTDSLVSSSRLLHTVRYPDESTGAAGSGGTYTVTYGYNRLGELRGMSDQNGTVHAYDRDTLGRVVADEVTNFGSTIDDRVVAITTAYDDHGRVAAVLSLDSGDDELNAVEFGYTRLHQIETIDQHLSYDTGTPRMPDMTGTVTYSYVNVAPVAGGTGNHSRLESITYPNEHGGDPTKLIGYGSGGSIGDRISRVAGLDVDGWASGTDDLVDYTYLGASIPVKVRYPATIGGLALDAIRGRYGEDGAATDTYHGFDQYGRVVWHGWVTDGFAPRGGMYPNTPNRTPLFGRAYEYDVDSNRIQDIDARPGAVRADRDWEYLYDELNRLNQADRGREDGGFTLATNSQNWTLDILGNWKAFGTDANGNGTFENTLAERQDRTHNRANEITLQERPNGMISQVVTQPGYDDAGNYRQNRASGSSRLVYTHDAWNRLVKVVRTTGPHTVLENEFNGLNHRTRRRMDLSQGNYDGVDEARWYFHSADWRMIEEHVDSDDDGDIERVAQQFWGMRYIDDAVGRRIDRDADGDWTTSPADNFYYLTDAMFSVRAVVDSSGLLHTRLDYTPYGVAMHGYGADVNGDGVVTITDLGLVSANYNGGTELMPGDVGYDPDAFLDGGDEINTTTYLSRYTPYVAGGSNPTFNDGWIDNPTDSNGPDNSVGYDGYWFDLAGATEATSSGLYMVRHRVYDPRLGRWLQRDPLPSMRTDSAAARLGFVPSRKAMSVVEISQLYLYARSAPGVYADPMGLCADRIDQVLRKMAGVLRKYAGLTNSLPDTGLLPDWLDGGKQFYKQNPKQHCVWNCRMTKRRGAGFAEEESDKKEALDIAMCELLLELGECASLLPADARRFLESHCQSATQPSDYLDNAAGRRCGCDAGLLAKYDSCEDCCDKEFGINSDTKEGPGTPRPFGPWWDNGRPNRPF